MGGGGELLGRSQYFKKKITDWRREGKHSEIGSKTIELESAYIEQR